MTVLFIFIGRMPFLVPTLENAAPFFALVITDNYRTETVLDGFQLSKSHLVI